MGWLALRVKGNSGVNPGRPRRCDRAKRRRTSFGHCDSQRENREKAHRFRARESEDLPA